jgi:predicted membrane protein
MSRLVLIIVIIVAAAVIGQALIHSFFPWLLVALVGFLWLRHHESNHHRA